MRFGKGLAVASGAAVLAAGGVGMVAGQRRDSPAKQPSAQVSTAKAAPATAQDVIQSIVGINQQVQSAGAQGHAMSREQIDLLIKNQLAQLGVNR